jgi:hypothetical protein
VRGPACARSTSIGRAGGSIRIVTWWSRARLRSVFTLSMAVTLWVGLYAIGLGPALELRRWTGLPLRFVGLLAMLSTAVVSYAVFWIAFGAPRTRLAVVAAALLVSVALAIRHLRVAADRRDMRRTTVWGPPALVGILAMVYLSPLLIGGPGVNDRFTWKLPSDNILPGLFAHRVVLGGSTVRPVPPLWPNGDRASERPPLQAAVVVTVGSVFPGIEGNEYQIVATLCQVQWLPAVWLIGAACGFPRRTIAFVLLGCAVSGFFFVNSIYTWPKLFAASLTLGALAVALEPPAAAPRAAAARVLVVAALCALSLLAHPGPLFTLLTVPFLWPVLRPVVGLRPTAAETAGAVALAIALFAPWLAYQACIDPPNGRLLREHLADGRVEGSVTQAVVRANVDRPLAEHVRIRAMNLAAQVGNPLVALWPRSIGLAQAEQFFHHGAALGVLLIGVVLTLARPRDDTPDDVVRRLTIVALTGMVVWSLVVFGPGQALIHHGSPVTTALLFFGGAYGLTRLPRALSWSLLAMHAAAGLYIWFLPVWRGPWSAG